LRKGRRVFVRSSVTRIGDEGVLFGAMCYIVRFTGVKSGFPVPDDFIVNAALIYLEWGVKIEVTGLEAVA